MKFEIEIVTEEEYKNGYSYTFTLFGKTYSDSDFTTRQAAIDEAKSVARTLIREKIS